MFSLLGSVVGQMPGEAFHGIYLFGIFKKLIFISKQATSGGKFALKTRKLKDIYIEKCYSICYNMKVEVSVLTIDEIVGEIRKQLGITQEQLARELNISFSTINRWENAHTIPSKLAKMRLVEFCKKEDIPSDIIDQINTL